LKKDMWYHEWKFWSGGGGAVGNNSQWQSEARVVVLRDRAPVSNEIEHATKIERAPFRTQWYRESTTWNCPHMQIFRFEP
jgi:hypothetical protein